jgi:cytidine deaminase
MQELQLPLNFTAYNDFSELLVADAQLLEEARLATEMAYAPYSKFKVGTAARLSNGVILKGSNQENASFPAGICAERVLLSICASLYPKMAIIDMAISYQNEIGKSDRPISPCGVCRQSLSEYQEICQHSIRLILGGKEGKIFIIEKASSLLPLAFTSADLFS